MNKLAKALNKIYKYAISKEEFEKLIKGKEQFAIISAETAIERSFADEKAYRLSPVEDVEQKRVFEPIEKSRTQNLRKHKRIREELRKDYNIHELDSQWAEETKTPSGESFFKIKKERSLFLKNISFNKAFCLAQSLGQESFIFKNADGPVQLIPTNPSNDINIAKRYAYSTGDNLYSKFLNDKSSIWFGFFLDDSISLPNYGEPYTWTDPEIKNLLLEEISDEEAEKYIDRPKSSKIIEDERNKWLRENQYKKEQKDKEISSILEDVEPWKGKHF